MSKIIPWAVGVSAAALLGVMGFTYSGSRRQADECGSKCGKTLQGCPDPGGCSSAAASRKSCGDANCGVKACVCKDCTCKGKCATCPAGCETSCGCKKTGAAPEPCGGDKGCGAKEGSSGPACPGLDKCGCSR